MSKRDSVYTQEYFARQSALFTDVWDEVFRKLLDDRGSLAFEYAAYAYIRDTLGFTPSIKFIVGVGPGAKGKTMVTVYYRRMKKDGTPTVRGKGYDYIESDSIRDALLDAAKQACWLRHSNQSAKSEDIINGR